MNRKIILWVILVLSISQWFNLNTNCNADSKKVLMVIANKDFRDEEFKFPFAALKREGYDVVIASSMLSSAKGMLGMSVVPDILLATARPLDYDAVIFVGGIGAQIFWDDVNAHQLAKNMYEDNKIVAAICIAPVILANAGILEGKKATVWKSESHRLEFQGASYTGRSVEVDGNIITADGPLSAEEFAQAIIKKLKIK
ncbi:MAG: DJ-1/PfpI family protein [Candidatus Omnitrophica bacterium]|nr:DJ-1/PfpI family protein [Candidatus Omnitrophota bacterium]